MTGISNSWTPNEKQARFMEILTQENGFITLAEIEAKYGERFATGTINVLVRNGLVENKDAEIEYVEVLAIDHSKVLSGVRKKCVKAWKIKATE